MLGFSIHFYKVNRFECRVRIVSEPPPWLISREDMPRYLLLARVSINAS